MDSYVWRVGLAKSGRNKVFKELTFIAENFFDLAHIIASEVYESDMFDFDVQVVSMERVKGLGKIVNYGGDDDEGVSREWSGNEPLEMAKNMSDDRVLVFKHDCGEQLRVPKMQWPFVRCPECRNRIYNREINDIGGIVIFSRIDELHKNDDKE